MHLDPLLPRLVAALAVLLAIGLALRRLKQPSVVAYLLAGVALGPAGLSVFDDKVILARLGDFGVVLLLFFVGMEVSLERLMRSWRVSIVGTVLQILASVGCVTAVGVWRGWEPARILLLGFVISLSSTAVVVSLLKARGALDSETGRDAIGVLVVQDLALAPMLVILGFFAGQAPTAKSLGLQGLGIVGVVLVLAALIRFDHLPLPLGRVLRRDHELQVFGALILCFALATLTGLLGLSTAVGAFVAGLVVGGTRETDWVRRSLEPFRVVLVALFFVSVGMLIDLVFLRQHWPTMLVLVLAVLFTNWLINAGILRALGRSWRHSLMVAALLAQVGEFSFVLAAVGRENGIIGDFAYQMTAGLIALTLLLSPLAAWLTGRLTAQAECEPAAAA